MKQRNRNTNYKHGITARFALEFPFQSLEISIENPKTGMEIPWQNAPFFQFLDYNLINL